MGRYIHADDYENKIIFKYWFGSQQSELEDIVCPFGGVVVNRATIDGVGPQSDHPAKKLEYIF